MSLTDRLHNSGNWLRKKVTSSESVETLVNEVEKLFKEYSQYVPESDNDTYQKKYEEVVAATKNEKYSKLDQVIKYVKNEVKKEGNSEIKYYLEHYILPPLIAKYSQENIKSRIPIKKAFIRFIKKRHQSDPQNIGGYFEDLIYRWGRNTEIPFNVHVAIQDARKFLNKRN